MRSSLLLELAVESRRMGGERDITNVGSMR